MVFVIRSLKLDYLKPALLDDLLAVSAQIKDFGRSRLALHQTVRRGEEVLVEAEIHLVCISQVAFKPVAIPDVLRDQWKG
jgi:acyl-CoA thioester hydrolase